MGDNDNVDDMYDLRKRIISSNEHYYHMMLTKLDKIELSCFVCKTPLKREQPKDNDSIVKSSNHNNEVYACKNGHVFSCEGLIHLFYERQSSNSHK